MSQISQTAGFIAAYEFCISHLYIAKKFKIFQNFLIICLCTLTLLICTCCLSYFFNTKRQEAFGFLMFYSRSDPEPAFLICVYRYKYKSHNHINTRYCWRQSHFFYILYLDHSKIYDIYSSKTPFVFYKMSQRFFLYRTTITKQINTAKFPNIENISSHNG